MGRNFQKIFACLMIFWTPLELAASQQPTGDEDLEEVFQRHAPPMPTQTPSPREAVVSIADSPRENGQTASAASLNLGQSSAATTQSFPPLQPPAPQPLQARHAVPESPFEGRAEVQPLLPNRNLSVSSPSSERESERKSGLSVRDGIRYTHYTLWTFAGISLCKARYDQNHGVPNVKPLVVGCCCMVASFVVGAVDYLVFRPWSKKPTRPKHDRRL